MADTPYREADIGFHPAKIWADVASLPAIGPNVGYGHVLIMETDNGPRLYIREATGNMIPCFAQIIDQTVTNEVLPPPFAGVATLPDLGDNDHAIIILTQSGDVKSMAWGNVLSLLQPSNLRDLLELVDLRAHRRGYNIVESFTLAKQHLDLYLNCENIASITCTVSTDETMNDFQNWVEVEFAQNGVGEVNVTPAAGVFINGQNTGFKISKQGGLVVMKRVGLNHWRAYGDMA